MPPTVPWCEAPLAPSLRELLSKAKLRECRRYEWCVPMVLHRQL